MKILNLKPLPEHKHVLAQPTCTLASINKRLPHLLQILIPTYAFHSEGDISQLFQDLSKFFPLVAQARILPSGVGTVNGFGGVYLVAFQGPGSAAILIMHERRSNADGFIGTVNEAERGDIAMCVAGNGKLSDEATATLKKCRPIPLWDIPGAGFTQPPS